MKKLSLLFLYFLIFLQLQVVLMKHIKLFPDISLLLVIFSGIFIGGYRGVVFAFVAGIARGIFSPQTIAADLIIFPMVSLTAYLFSMMLDGQNPVSDALISLVCVLIVVSSHLGFLSFYHMVHIDIFYVIFTVWKQLALTVLISPLVFMIMEKLTGDDRQEVIGYRMRRF